MMFSQIFVALRKYGFGSQRVIPSLDGLRAISIGFVLVAHLTGTRNFYFDADARAMMIRQKFVEHLGRMFAIMGYDSAKARVAAVNLMKLETAIAKASRKPEDTRDQRNDKEYCCPI